MFMAVQKRLVGGLYDVAPETGLRVHLVGGRNRHANGDVHKDIVHLADDNPGFAGHGRVYRVLGQLHTKDGVMGIGRDTSNHIAGINIFQAYFGVIFFKIVFYGLF